MIQDPERRGRALAEFYRIVGPRLLADLEGSGLLVVPTTDTARVEWECFALYACVRGLVAAGGFNQETGRALDAFHDSVLAGAGEEHRALIARRYTEYGEIGQAGGAGGAATVTERLGVCAAAHLSAPAPPPRGLAELAGGLHEALTEGAAETVRSGE